MPTYATKQDLLDRDEGMLWNVAIDRSLFLLILLERLLFLAWLCRRFLDNRLFISGWRTRLFRGHRLLGSWRVRFGLVLYGAGICNQFTSCRRAFVGLGDLLLALSWGHITPLFHGLSHIR